MKVAAIHDANERGVNAVTDIKQQFEALLQKVEEVLKSCELEESLERSHIANLRRTLKEMASNEVRVNL